MTGTGADETDPVQAPTRTDPVARSMVERIGGPVGERARPHRFWTPVRVLLVAFTLLSCLSIVRHQPCISTDWSNNTVRYSKMCYSDVPYLYVGRGMAERVWPYQPGDTGYQTMEYPVGISYVAWASAQLLRPVAAGPDQQTRDAAGPAGVGTLPGMADETNEYFLLTAILMICCGFATVLLLAGVDRRRPWQAMLFALSPTLLFTQLINWDMLAVVCVAGAMWAHARGRPVLTGVLIGVGTAMKLYPLFLLGGLLVIAIHRRQWRGFALASGSAVAAWVVLNVPAVVQGTEKWTVFWTFNSDRGPDLGSLWLLFAQHSHAASAHTINVVSWVVFSICCVLVLALGLQARRTPTFAQLGFLIVAAFLIVNKVYSPQYVLWLLPLAIIARPKWRDLLIWQACELFYFGAVWLYLGQFTASATSGGTDPLYGVAIVVRVLGELFLVALVVRDIVTAKPDPSVDQDPIETAGGEADPRADLAADLGH